MKKNKRNAKTQRRKEGFFFTFFSFLTLSTCQDCFALQEAPWYGNVFEFNLLANYEYNFFKKVNHGTPQRRSVYNSNIFGAQIDLTAPDTWNWEVEIEFAGTSNVSTGYRSFAIQARKLWLDDVACDPVSLSTGLVYRDASAHLRKALSTPYHARANFEFHTAVGKEWSRCCDWILRTYAVGAIGQGTKGSPWLRGDLWVWWNHEECHQIYLMGRSYFGLGKRSEVRLKHFRGWSHIGHQSIDVGIGYRRFFGIYGSLRFDYLHRVYARSYPEKVNFFLFTYEFPFSCF